MAKKPKFKPVVTRVKLNPEQAVLTCSCYSEGWQFGPGTPGVGGRSCYFDSVHGKSVVELRLSVGGVMTANVAS
jgi:hypothetical protein